METEGGSGLRTRSKAAPDWTVEESLILVNEVSVIETDCRDTLSSFQKWKIIVENCNALDVNRNLNQCRRKWDSLLSDYKKLKQSGSKKASFDSELFKAIERYVREHEGDADGGYDTDPDSESDSGGSQEPILAAFVQSATSGSKKQRSKVIPQKRSIEESVKPKRRIKSEELRVEQCSSEEWVNPPTNNKLDETVKPEETSQEEKEQTMAEQLREDAEVIEAIVKGHMGEDSRDFSTINLVNGKAGDLIRLNGDKLIICLSNLAVTLDQLCELVQ